MTSAGKISDRGGGYISFLYAPGTRAADATSRFPTNTPPAARLLAVSRVNWASNGTINFTNWGVVGKTTSPGAAKAALVDFRTIRVGTATTVKQAMVVLVKLAAEGYSGGRDDRQ